MFTALAIGFISALLSSMSGAGAALFATPLFLWAGVSLPTALACNQLCAAVWTPIASRNYKGRGSLDRRLVAGVAAVGIVGVCFGYKLAMNLPPERFKPTIGVLILLVVGVVWMRPVRSGSSSSRRGSRVISMAFGFPLGAYQAFFGGGNTLFSALMFCRIRGFDFKRALAHAYAVAFVWCSLAALLFWIEGWMRWDVVIPAVVGSTVGASLGSYYGRGLSHTALRRVFLIAGAFMGGRLLLL
jgi:uncharacterized membrane protein YfcA